MLIRLSLRFVTPDIIRNSENGSAPILKLLGREQKLL